jgi:hypothetical protein
MVAKMQKYDEEKLFKILRLNMHMWGSQGLVQKT